MIEHMADAADGSSYVEARLIDDDDRPDSTGDGSVSPPPYLSPSSASAFEQCPRRWRYKYVEREPEPSGPAALVGSFAHLVLEFLCGLPAKHRTQEQAKALARELWPDFEHDPDYAALDLDDAASRAFRWEAWLAILGLWDLEDPAAVEVVSTEQKVNATLGDVPFVGVIDRVDRRPEGLVVSDYKSGTLPRVRWRGDKLKQVMLYAAALTDATGEQPERARLLYLGQRVLDVAVTDRRIAEAADELGATWGEGDDGVPQRRVQPSARRAVRLVPVRRALRRRLGRAEPTIRRRHPAGSRPRRSPRRLSPTPRSPRAMISHGQRCRSSSGRGAPKIRVVSHSVVAHRCFCQLQR